jgi:hypothetical protein
VCTHPPTQHRRRWETNSTSILLNTQKETRSRWGEHRQPPCGRLECRAVRGATARAQPLTQDTKHALFVQSGLVHMETEEGPRAHLPLITGGTAETVSSRIDDILMSKKNLQGTSRGPQEGTSSDHAPLLVTLKHSRQACIPTKGQTGRPTTDWCSHQRRR